MCSFTIFELVVGLSCHDSFWNNEFKLFYDPDTGLDIDGAWIDMNEPSSVCC